MLPPCRRPTPNRIHPMNALPKADMLEATRLTREGRFEEAMAVLRGALPGASAAPAPPDSEGAASQATKRRPAILDMVPPLPGTGGAWTAPPTGGGQAAG